MGKARSKKHSRHQPYQASNRPAGAGGATTGAVYTTLDADLGSLDQSKRQKACMLLSDLYLFNITNEQSIDTLTSASILGKLAMRLVDSSDKVRVQAAGALKNLSESSDIRVVRKLVSCGIVRSALTLSLEAVSMGMGGWEAIGAMGVEYLEQLLHTLANTLATEQTQTQNTQNTQSTQNTAGQRGGPLHELLSCADFAPRLLSLLDVRTPAGVLSGALHLLLLLSELAPATLGAGGGGGGDGGRASLLRLWGFAESVALQRSELASTVAAAATVASVSAATSTSASSQLTVLLLEALEVVLSLFAHAPTSLEIEACCNVPQAVRLLIGELGTASERLVEAPAVPVGEVEEEGGAMEEEETGGSEGGSGEGNAAGGGTGGEERVLTAAEALQAAVLRDVGIIRMVAGVLGALCEAVTLEDSIGKSVAKSGEVRRRAVVLGALAGEGGNFLHHPMWEQLLRGCGAAQRAVLVSTLHRAGAEGGAEVGAGAAGAAGAVVGAGVGTWQGMVVTAAVAEALECVDEAAAAMQSLVALLAQEQTGAQGAQGRGTVEVGSVVELVQPLMELVLLTMPAGPGTAGAGAGAAGALNGEVMAEEAQTQQTQAQTQAQAQAGAEGAGEGLGLGGKGQGQVGQGQVPYLVEGGVTIPGFRSRLLAATSALLECLALLARHATPSGAVGGGPAGAWVLVPVLEEQVRALALLVVRGASHCNVEVSLQAVLLAATMGQRDSVIRDIQPQGAQGEGLLSVQVNALLTNALLRRAQDPSAYSSATLRPQTQAQGVHAQGAATGVDIKRGRLLEGSLRLLDALLNAIIDLHTSDSTAFLALYWKLSAPEKISQAATLLGERLSVVAEASNYASGAAGGAPWAPFDSGDFEKFSETLENVQSFLEYKQSFRP